LNGTEKTSSEAEKLGVDEALSDINESWEVRNFRMMNLILKKTTISIRN